MSTTKAVAAPVTRTVEVYESQPDAKELDNHGWSFQIAKSVANADPPPPQGTFNVVWQSKQVAPDYKISWNEQYGLNWTQTLPDPGAQVTASGVWQAFSPGDVFDIDKDGFWVPSTKPPKPDFMTVGDVGFQISGTDGLHIVVGLQNAAGTFDPIFVDPTPLALHDSGFYQPQEIVQWWYQSGEKTATMIDGHSTAIESRDMSKADPTTEKFYYSTTYVFEPTASWNTSPNPPPSS